MKNLYPFVFLFLSTIMSVSGQSDGYVYYGIGDLEAHSRKLKVKGEMERMKEYQHPLPKYQANTPDGWSSVASNNEEQTYILGSNTLQGMIILGPVRNNYVPEILQEMNVQLQSAGITLGGYNNLDRFGQYGVSGTTTGDYAGTSMKIYFVIIPSPQGGAVLVLVMTHSNVFTNEHIKAVNSLANTIKF